MQVSTLSLAEPRILTDGENVFIPKLSARGALISILVSFSADGRMSFSFCVKKGDLI